MPDMSKKLHDFSMKRLLPLGIIFSSCLLILACENSQKDIDVWVKEREARETAIGVESYLSQEGKVKARLISTLMYRSLRDTQYLEFPNDLHVDFYDDSTEIETWLDAKYGKYYEALDKVYLRDSVVIITRNQDTLRCHYLWWDQNKGIFYTDSVATYRSPGNDIVGGLGMEATQDLKTVTFKHPIATLETNSGGFVEEPQPQE